MKRLNIPVDEYTTPSPVTVSSQTSMPDLMAIMKNYEIRHIPVVDDEVAVGIISDRDLKMMMNVEGANALQAGDLMHDHPYTVESGTSLEQVVLEMSKNKIGSAIVNNDGNIVGIFTSTDALNALVEVLRGEVP
jgi:acetoin utilization protein AcuB